MSANYYACESMQHTDFHCLQHSYINKRFTYERWCEVCQKRWPQ